MEIYLNLQRLQELEYQLHYRKINNITKNDLRYLHLLVKEADKDTKKYIKKILLNNHLCNLNNPDINEMKLKYKKQII